MAIRELELVGRQAVDDSVIAQVELQLILSNPLNPREEILDSECEGLGASIKENGVLEPLVITPQAPGSLYFYAVAGHRRRIGARLAGLLRVPCIIRELTEEQQLDLMMIENIQREDLKPIQEARGFQRMMAAGRSIDAISAKLGLLRSFIESRLVILRLDKAVQELFEQDLLPIGAAAILVLVSDPAKQRQFANRVAQGQLSIAKLEQIIRERNRQGKAISRLGGNGSKQRVRRKVLGEYEVFTRSEALSELNREGEVTYKIVGEAFNDICEGLCVEDGSKAMCEACPAPRLIASLLRRTGVELKGQKEA